LVVFKLTLLPAVPEQFFTHPLDAGLLAADVLGEPGAELLCVGDAALPEAGGPADLDPVPLDLPAVPVVEADLG